MVIKRISFDVLIIAALCSSYVRAQGVDPSITIEGTVSYQPRMGLPADSILQLSVIEDTKDGKHVRGKQITLQHDQIPIPFTLDVPKSKIEPGHVYRIEAQIKIKDRTWYKGAAKLPAELRNDVTSLNMVIGPVQ